MDFGPGVGRLLLAYDGLVVRTVVGYDISTLYKGRVIEEAKRYGYHFVFTTENKLTRLPFKDLEFPVAVAAEVLLHQRPENILRVMGELARVAEKVIVITWMEEPHDKARPSPSNRKGHCFSYNYPRICEEQNWDIGDITKYRRQVFFVYGRQVGKAGR